MVQLAQERDWFRTEAVKLNAQAKSQEKTLIGLRDRLANTLEERDMFLAQLYEQKANVRELTKELNNYKLRQLNASRKGQAES